MTDDSAKLPVGTLLFNGKYRIEQFLAAGGFGNTYRARDLQFDEQVAVKELFLKEACGRTSDTLLVSVSLTANQKSFESFREKLRKEARRLRKLHNPHIVAVRDLFDENGTTYYAMDYIEGQSLARRLKVDRSPLPEREVMTVILPQLLDALATVHAAGIWHLDLKPDNIMQTPGGNIVLIDFGASKQPHVEDGALQLSSTTNYLTKGYAPSEQMAGKMEKYGPWTDFYALGATLFNLLTNECPPERIDLADNPHFLQDSLRAMSPATVNLIVWMMNDGTKQRPQNVEKIRAFLKENMNGTFGNGQGTRASHGSSSSASASAQNASRSSSSEAEQSDGNEGTVIRDEEQDSASYDPATSSSSSDSAKNASQSFSMEAENPDGNGGTVVRDREQDSVSYDSATSSGGQISTDAEHERLMKWWSRLLVNMKGAIGMERKDKPKQMLTAKSNKPKRGLSNLKGHLSSVPNLQQELDKLANNMVYVQGGTFMMGFGDDGQFTVVTHADESETDNDEKPTHRVTLSSYYICKYEVTQLLWESVMGSNSSQIKGDNLPVECVSWYDCQQFISKLNALTGQHYRLPTEAEWEFAARGGNISRKYKYSGSNILSNVAWYDGNCVLTTHPVGIKSPNELGLYDMSGNVDEWCLDWYGSYKCSAQTNPAGPSIGMNRVLRGGSWGSSDSYCRVSRRKYDTPDSRSGYIGLRLVRSCPAKKK